MLFQNATANFTRPADTMQYAAGDLVANSTTAGSVTPMTFRHQTAPGGWLRRVMVSHSNQAATGSSFRLWLFSSSPTVSNGDNGALAVTSPDPATLLGNVAVTADNDWGDTTGFAYVDTGFFVPSVFYGLLEARGTYTPANAEIFTIGCSIEGGAF